MKLCPQCRTGFEGSGWCCPRCKWQPPIIEGFPALSEELAHNSGGFRPEFFQMLFALEQENFWFRSRNELVAWVLQRFFAGARRVMEIGCGTGYVLSRIAATFPEAELMGSEAYSAGLRFTSSRVPHAELVQMDARRIPYVDHFDVICAFDVVEHIVEDDDVFAQIHSALRHGGGLVLTVPQHEWLWSRQDELACHVRRYRAPDLRNKLRLAGFSILWASSFVSLLLPLMWISRRARGSIPDDGSAELRLGRTTNLVLGAVLTFERRLIRAGLRFPMGGSLLVVALRD